MTVIVVESGIEFDVMVGLEEADLYAYAVFDADAYRAATDLVKIRALVTASREFDAACWAGSKTDADQTHAFPRTGLSRGDGTQVDSATIPDEVSAAIILRAISLVKGTDAANQANVDANIRRLAAGSAEIEYFKATGEKGVFPPEVMNLIGRWLCGVSGIAASLAYGTDQESLFTDDYTFSDGF